MTTLTETYYFPSISVKIKIEIQTGICIFNYVDIM